MVNVVSLGIGASRLMGPLFPSPGPYTESRGRWADPCAWTNSSRRDGDAVSDIELKTITFFSDLLRVYFSRRYSIALGHALYSGKPALLPKQPVFLLMATPRTCQERVSQKYTPNNTLKTVKVDKGQKK